METCETTVVCLVRHFTGHRFNSAISETFQFTKKELLHALHAYVYIKVSGKPSDNKLITSETISDSAECSAGLSVRFETSAV